MCELLVCVLLVCEFQSLVWCVLPAAIGEGVQYHEAEESKDGGRAEEEVGDEATPGCPSGG